MTTDTLTRTLLQDFEMVSIADIVIGDRYRKNPEQDIDKLAQSIEDVGLLNPVVITQSLELVAGHRRLLACQKLGYDEIEAHYVHDLDEAAMLLAEGDENTCRVQFTAAEARALYNRRKEILAPVAAANSAANLKKGKAAPSPQVETSDEPATNGKKPSGRTGKAAAAGLGVGETVLEAGNKLEAIAADAGQPDEVRELAETNLAAADSGKKGTIAALDEVKQAQAKAVGHRGQRKALDVLVRAAEKQALIIEKTFLEDGEPVENFDDDCTVDDVALSFKDFRAAVARINKVAKAVASADV